MAAINMGRDMSDSQCSHNLTDYSTLNLEGNRNLKRYNPTLIHSVACLDLSWLWCGVKVIL